MKTHATFPVPLLAVFIIVAGLERSQAQKAATLDDVAAKAQLSKPAVKPRFIPKSAIKSRTYKMTGKGAGVEIVEYADGARTESPYVAIPILFVRGTDQLLDVVSRDNVAKTARILRDLLAGDPKARFTIQGHTSVEGEADANLLLSQLRAKRIFTMLTEGQGLDASRLGQEGFGGAFASAPLKASNAEHQRDRRVLVVKQ